MCLYLQMHEKEQTNECRLHTFCLAAPPWWKFLQVQEYHSVQDYWTEEACRSLHRQQHWGPDLQNNRKGFSPCYDNRFPVCDDWWSTFAGLGANRSLSDQLTDFLLNGMQVALQMKSLWLRTNPPPLMHSIIIQTESLIMCHTAPCSSQGFSRHANQEIFSWMWRCLAHNYQERLSWARGKPLTNPPEQRQHVTYLWQPAHNNILIGTLSSHIFRLSLDTIAPQKEFQTNQLFLLFLLCLASSWGTHAPGVGRSGETKGYKRAVGRSGM